MALDYFPCYHSYARKIAKLSDQEVGRLFRALLNYSDHGETPELAGRESVAFDFIADDIDRARENYQATCEKNRENITKRYDRVRSYTGVYDRTPPYTNVYEIYQSESKSESESESKNKSESKESEAAPQPPRPLAQKTEPRKAYGRYGWIRLTGAEAERLKADLGEAELARCIEYVDESAQANGNKNRWKDWNLVLRKCSRDGWGKGRRAEKQDDGSAAERAEPGTWNGYKLQSALDRSDRVRTEDG